MKQYILKQDCEKCNKTHCVHLICTNEDDIIAEGHIEEETANKIIKAEGLTVNLEKTTGKTIVYS